MSSSNVGKSISNNLRSTRILAADIWHTHFLSNPMNRNAGLKYRDLILSKGGNQDEMKSLIELLGRKPNLEAFFLYDLRIKKSQVGIVYGQA